MRTPRCWTTSSRPLRPEPSDLDESRAAALEAADPLPSLKDEFAIPPWPGGRFPDWAYLAGNSLGLQPRAARSAVEEELDEWARLGVEGWFESREPWLDAAASLRASVGRLVGASEEEVAVMNTLTVNLHLLLTSFYRPTSERFRIVIEDAAFPSDSYAVQSQAALSGFDPGRAVLRLSPGRARRRSAPGTSSMRSSRRASRSRSSCCRA